MITGSTKITAKMLKDKGNDYLASMMRKEFPFGKRYQDLLDKLCKQGYWIFAQEFMEVLGRTDDTREYENVHSVNGIVFAGDLIFKGRSYAEAVIAGGALTFEDWTKVPDVINSGGNLIINDYLECGEIHSDAGLESSGYRIKVERGIWINWDSNFKGRISAGLLQCEGHLESEESVHAVYGFKSGSARIKGDLKTLSGRVSTNGDLECGSTLVSGNYIEVNGKLTVSGNIISSNFIYAKSGIKIPKDDSIIAGIDHKPEDWQMFGAVATPEYSEKILNGMWVDSEEFVRRGLLQDVKTIISRRRMPG